MNGTDLSTKDILTLDFSALALIVAISSAVFNSWMQRRTMWTSVRSQLTSIVQDLIAAQESFSELQTNTSGASDSSGTRSIALNHKLTSLARQACELDRMAPKVAFDVELIAIANALGTSGDVESAETYHRRAIERAQNSYYQSINRSLFAGFLFERYRYEEGRDAYRQALAVLPCDTDDNKAANVMTYRSWLASEARHFPVPNKQFDSCRAAATKLIESIKSDAMRMGWLNQFDAEWPASPV